MYERMEAKIVTANMPILARLGNGTAHMSSYTFKGQPVDMFACGNFCLPPFQIPDTRSFLERLSSKSFVPTYRIFPV